MCRAGKELAVKKMLADQIFDMTMKMFLRWDARTPNTPRGTAGTRQAHCGRTQGNCRGRGGSGCCGLWVVVVVGLWLW